MNKAKQKTVARGYGQSHRADRKRWEPKVKTGTVPCRRCHEPIRPDEPWDLGHDDFDRSLPRAPEHRRCNRATRAHEAKRRTRKGRLYGVTGAEQGRSDIPEDPDKPTGTRASGTSYPTDVRSRRRFSPTSPRRSMLIGARAEGRSRPSPRSSYGVLKGLRSARPTKAATVPTPSIGDPPGRPSRRRVRRR